MISIFSRRGLIYIWVIVLAIAAQNSFVLALLDWLGNSELQDYVEDASAWLNSIAPRVIQLLFTSFNWSATLTSPSGTISISTATFLAVAAVLFLVFAFLAWRKAIKSKSFFDDFFALIFFYVTLEVFAGILAQLQVLPDPARQSVIAGIMTLLVILLMRRANAFHDSKIFFRGLLQIYLIWAFIMPEMIVMGTLNAFEQFSNFCAELWPNPSSPVQVVAAIAGIAAAGLLYRVGTKPKPPAGPVLDALKAKIGEDIDSAKKVLQ